MATVEPLGSRVLLKVLEEANQTASGILLPETAKERPQRGTVIGVGPEAAEDTDLEEGDVVIYPKYGGTEIQVEGEDYLIIDADEILARVK